jgi:hypothetical protein
MNAQEQPAVAGPSEPTVRQHCPRFGVWPGLLDGLALGPLWRRIGLLPKRECGRMKDGYCARCHADMYP